MQDVVPVFRVSSGDSIFDAKLPLAESKTDGAGSHGFSLRLRCVDSISDRKMATTRESIRLEQICQTYLVRFWRVFGGRGVEHNDRGFRSKRGEHRRIALQPDDHDVSGFYKGGDGLAVFQAYFADGIGGDDGRNPLAAPGKP
jgi:hypothetical protein